MSDDTREFDFSRLTSEQKLRLVHELWDDLMRSPEAVPLTPEQEREAERRLRDHEANPRRYTKWEDLRRRLTGDA